MMRRALLAGLLAAPAIARADTLMPRFRSPSLWRPGAIPPAAARFRINREHPLGRGLIACYIPGSAYGWRDVANTAPPLAPNTNGGLLTAAPGAASNANGANPTGAQTAIAPATATFNVTSGVTVAWYGQHVSNFAGNDVAFFGLIDSAGSPFYYYALGAAAGAPNALRMFSNNAGSFVSLAAGGNASLTAPMAFIGTLPMGGATGQSAHDGALGSTYVSPTPSYNATARIGLGFNGSVPTRIGNNLDCAGLIWNRVLSNDEMLLWTREPMAMLRPETIHDRALVKPGGGMLLLNGS